MHGLTRGHCRNLSDIFADSVHCGEKASVAHLAIDVQDDYIYNDHDRSVARRIGKCIAPQFTALGHKNYWVYFRARLSFRMNALGSWAFRDTGDTPQFNKSISPAKQDSIIVKTETSVIRGSNIEEELKSSGYTAIAISGFTAGVCVLDSVLDLRALGYKVAVLEDGTDMVPEFTFAREQMQSVGAVITTSDHFFRTLEKL